MADYKKIMQDEIRDTKLDEKAKTYVTKSKQFAEDKDLKNNASGAFSKFIDGLKRLDTIPVLIATFVMMLLIWIPLMYDSMTISVLSGQDSMSNKEMRELDGRLQDRYKTIFGF
ncbi:hypothetical protein [Macrococcus carouselicus]|uniref:Uncharacterized protein n=1 Tax=Macrococcus carouselicus TaxID=69969 RepID=A0A9Q8CFV4_9STAP|nr:hypothetical protein [Macrococcus carouselicus]TDM02204.1 hypothetical protein ERX40_06515 [Macrococcus carouselicus]